MVPNNTNRTCIVGRTGSGKTQFGVYFLGVELNGAWKDMPVTIFNPKNTRLVNSLGAKEWSVQKPPPVEPGLYVVRPFPEEDTDAVTEYLLRVWEQENHGLYFDEILDLGTRNKGFRRLLSQGREKHIPMIYCTQRPAWIDQYAFSEADFFAVFDLSKDDDIKRAKKDVPGYDETKLDRYEPYWYDVIDKRGTILNPCPSEAQILKLYENLKPKDDMTNEYVDDQARSSRRKAFL